jgi:transcription elongation GreA/GreB family factor
MSRAFVKEDAATEDMLDRPISPHPNYLTADGLAEIERSLEAARQTHSTAQVRGDRGELAKASREVRYWSARRGSARPVTPDPNRHTVQFGSAVTIVRDARKQTFRIVGEDEADPSDGKISYVSPPARAVMNKEAGETALLAESEIEMIDVSSY